MKNLSILGLVSVVLFTAAFACNMSTANLSSLKTLRDKDGAETSTYKAGDTVYANAAVGNNPGKVSVKMYITVEDAPGMKKGDVIPNSEVKLELEGDGVAKYNYPTYATTKGGKFNVVAEMMNDAGEKKDTKTAAFTVMPGNAAGDPASTDGAKIEDEEK